jgi:hypothetical protein
MEGVAMVDAVVVVAIVEVGVVDVVDAVVVVADLDAAVGGTVVRTPGAEDGGTVGSDGADGPDEQAAIAARHKTTSRRHRHSVGAAATRPS